MNRRSFFKFLSIIPFAGKAVSSLAMPKDILRHPENVSPEERSRMLDKWLTANDVRRLEDRITT